MPLLEYIEVLGSREMSWARIGEFLYEEVYLIGEIGYAPLRCQLEYSLSQPEFRLHFK